MIRGDIAEKMMHCKSLWNAKVYCNQLNFIDQVT